MRGVVLSDAQHGLRTRDRRCESQALDVDRGESAGCDGAPRAVNPAVLEECTIDVIGDRAEVVVLAVDLNHGNFGARVAAAVELHWSSFRPDELSATCLMSGKSSHGEGPAT